MLHDEKYVQFIPISSLINVDDLKVLKKQTLVTQVMCFLKDVLTPVNIEENQEFLEDDKFLKTYTDLDNNTYVFELTEDVTLHDIKHIINFPQLSFENLHDTKQKILSLNLGYIERDLNLSVHKYDHDVPNLIFDMLHVISLILTTRQNFIKWNKFVLTRLYTRIVFCILYDYEKNDGLTHIYKFISSDGFAPRTDPFSHFCCAIFTVQFLNGFWSSTIKYGRNAVQYKIDRNIYQNDELLDVVKSSFNIPEIWKKDPQNHFLIPKTLTDYIHKLSQESRSKFIKTQQIQTIQ